MVLDIRKNYMREITFVINPYFNYQTGHRYISCQITCTHPYSFRIPMDFNNSSKKVLTTYVTTECLHEDSSDFSHSQLLHKFFYIDIIKHIWELLNVLFLHTLERIIILNMLISAPARNLKDYPAGFIVETYLEDTFKH